MTATQPVDGILLLDKPQGLSSNVALQRAKRLLGAKKAGHTGSLDPLATGMLPICFGDATKFSQYLLDADKAYEVTGVLGAVSNTGDAEGELTVRTESVNISQAALDEALQQVTGPIQQVPPMYSALKHQGKPLYTYARQGIELERPARDVIIYDAKCLEIDGNIMKFAVKCSKGTYIRTWIEMLGELLGVGAYVTQLHRTYTAGFEHEPMWRLEDLAAESLEVRQSHLLPAERAVRQFPKLEVSFDVVGALYQGKVIEGLSNLPAAGLVQLYDPKAFFLGLGEVTAKHTLKVKRLKQRPSL